MVQIMINYGSDVEILHNDMMHRDIGIPSKLSKCGESEFRDFESHSSQRAQMTDTERREAVSQSKNK